MPEQEAVILSLLTSGIVGGLLTPLISFVKEILGLNVEGTTDAEKLTKKRLKLGLTVVICIGAGLLVVALLPNQVFDTLEGKIGAMTTMFTAANLAYGLFFKESKAEKVVLKTAKKLK